MLTSELRQTAIELKKSGKGISAIKLIKDTTGSSLKDCKDYVDDLNMRTDSDGKCIMGEFSLTAGDIRAMKTADRIEFIHQRRDKRVFTGYAGIIRCMKSYSDDQLRLDPYLTARKAEVNIPVKSIMVIGGGMHSYRSDINKPLLIGDNQVLIDRLYGQVETGQNLQIFLDMVKTGSVVSLEWCYGYMWHGTCIGSYGQCFTDRLYILMKTGKRERRLLFCERTGVYNNGGQYDSLRMINERISGE